MDFKSSDIRWVKNVKRDNGTSWAFFENNQKNQFALTFSKQQINGAKEIKVGEIVLLFQNFGNAKKPYLTHLVTPRDNELRENATNRFKWERDVIVIARAELPLNSPISTNFKYNKVGFGRPDTISRLDVNREIVKIQSEIWTLFSGLINPELDQVIENIIPENIIDPDFSVWEGQEIQTSHLKSHIRKERNPIIVGLVKSRAMEDGTLRCNCCNFDFMKQYGELGYGFIECHHRIPIGTGGERQTRAEDLALVCANCHRMLHRKKTDGSYHTVESLKKQVKVRW